MTTTPRGQTIMGWLLVGFGLAVVWQYTQHTAHGHALDSIVLWVGVGIAVAGGYYAHQGATKALAGEVRKFIPFLRDKSGS